MLHIYGRRFDTQCQGLTSWGNILPVEVEAMHACQDHNNTQQQHVSALAHGQWCRKVKVVSTNAEQLIACLRCRHLMATWCTPTTRNYFGCCVSELTNSDLDLAPIQHRQIIDNIQHGASHLDHPFNRTPHTTFCSVLIMACMADHAKLQHLQAPWQACQLASSVYSEAAEKLGWESFWGPRCSKRSASMKGR